MKLTKKNKIVLITLSVVLVALLIVYFVAVAPLLEDDDFVLPIPLDGEGIFGSSLTIYKCLDQEDIVSIHISNKHGEYKFNNVKDEKGNYVGKINGLEELQFDEAYYGFLLSLAMDPTTVDNIPYRNLTDEQMKEYGVTEDTCTATMTVTYKDGNQTKSHVLRIGYASFTANTTYYVSYDGRNTAYRFPAGAEFATLPLENYVTPIIYEKYSSPSEAMINIVNFSLYNGTMNGSFNPYLMLTGKQSTEIQDGQEYVSTKYSFHILGDDYKIVKSTDADLNYCINVISIFYTQFYGDMVVKINPDEATYDKYGLGRDDEIYMVRAVNAEDDIPVFLISKPIYDEETDQNYYYTTAARDDVELLIRIPESLFIPQNQFKDVESVLFDETKLINWAATNTIGAGFSQAIQADGVKYPGVDKITIKVPTSVYEYGEETFHIDYVTNDQNQKILNVTTSSGRYEDKGPELRKNFNAFFKVLISYPIVSRFNNFTDAEVQQYATDDNLVYSIEAVMNDGTVEKYEYYKISVEYVMLCVTKGEYKDGKLEWGAKKCIFDSTKAQIQDGIYKAFNELMSGQPVSVQ